MKRRCNSILLGILFFAAAGPLAAERAGAADQVPPGTFGDTIQPFLKEHCINCHNPEKRKGDLSLEAIDGNIAGGKDIQTWKSVAEMIATGEMPPVGRPRPSPHAAGRVLVTIKAGLSRGGVDVTEIGRKLNLPQHGNRVDHDALFDAGTRAVAASPVRLWRSNPQMYTSFGRRVFGKNTSFAQPFSSSSAEGFKDYADLFQIDEPTINQLLRNADAAVAVQTAARGGQKELAAIVSGTPTPQQVETAIKREFQLVLRRDPLADELARFVALYEKNVKDAGQEDGARATLAAVFLLPEALYRLEIGTGPTDAHGRRMLAPRELANAIALALGDDGPDAELLKAADGGRLASRADVQREVERLFAEPKFAKPRILRFFEEYFEYPHAADVFKDLKQGEWRPEILVNDTRELIQWVLDQDKDVLRTLLTTNKSFVNFRRDPKTGGQPARIANKKDDKPRDPKKPPNPRRMEYSDLYNLPETWEWTAEQPVDLPGEQRAGILTQPSWLAAFATNNETHAIKRGKWVRERLLGGSVPDLPITVDAMLPNTPERTIRQRMEVTRQEYCWNCHQQMNPIGLTFESYDFLGRHRTTETVVDAAATAARQTAANEKVALESAKKKKPLPDRLPMVEPVLTEAPLETSGAITLTGDSALDGPAPDAVTLIKKLAGSTRVRQVFVRHAFRFWMGRNETLDDAPTLVAADQAYVQSGGSMKALVAALLTSDSFLYRRAEAAK